MAPWGSTSLTPNEFELFFQSIGLKPSEFDSFLPRDLMYLKDAPELLDNYRVLCNYGIARDKIGKIYMEATEVFGYKRGVLKLKLRAYQELGLSKSTVIKIVPSSPPLLLGDVNRAFVKQCRGKSDDQKVSACSDSEDGCSREKD